MPLLGLFHEYVDRVGKSLIRHLALINRLQRQCGIGRKPQCISQRPGRRERFSSILCLRDECLFVSRFRLIAFRAGSRTSRNSLPSRRPSLSAY